MPSAIGIDLSDWGTSGQLVLPDPLSTPTEPVYADEFERESAYIEYRGTDNYEQQWTIRFDLLREDVFTVGNPENYDDRAFGAKLAITIIAQGTECRLIRWVNPLTGSVPIESLQPNPCNFRRVRPDPPTANRWETRLNLLREPLQTPCQNEGIQSRWYWRQVPNFELQDRSPWFVVGYFRGGGARGNVIFDPEGRDRALWGRPPGVWAQPAFVANPKRAICLDPVQFPGEPQEFPLKKYRINQKFRCEGFLPNQAPGQFAPLEIRRPIMHISNSELAPFGGWKGLILWPELTEGVLLGIAVEEPAFILQDPPIRVGTLTGITLSGGQFDFELELVISLIYDSFPRRWSPSWKLNQPTSNTSIIFFPYGGGNPTLRDSAPICVGIGPRWRPNDGWDGPINEWATDGPLLLSGKTPTVERRDITIEDITPS